MKLGHFSKVLLIIFVFSAVFSIPNDAKSATPSNDPSGIGEMVIYGFGNVSTWVLLKGGAIYLGITGYLFDKALDFTVRDVRTTYSVFEKTVNDIWIIIRDFGNIIIVFSMLYLAIKTILQGNGWADKKALTGILLAALLINFSLFFTKLVFDGSNIAANAIYSSINLGAEGGTQGAGFSTTIMGMFNYQDLVNKSYNLSEDFISRMSSQLIMAIFGFILMFITGCIFLSAILLLIIRFIFFIGLMMTSALALVGYFIPFLRAKASAWWTQLWKQALVLPAFMMCLYVSFLVIQMALININIKSIKWTELISGNIEAISVSFNSAFVAIFYIILSLGLLIASVILPGLIGGAGASILKTGTANIAGKGSAWMGRRMIGAGRVSASVASRGLDKFETTRNFKTALKSLPRDSWGAAKERGEGVRGRVTSAIAGFGARRLVDTKEGLKNRSFDFRNIKIGDKTLGSKYNLGEGAQSYNKIFKQEQEKLKKEAEAKIKKYGFGERSADEKWDDQVKLSKISSDKKKHQKNKKENLELYFEALKLAESDPDVAKRKEHTADAEKFKEDAKKAEEEIKKLQKEALKIENPGEYAFVQATNTKVNKIVSFARGKSEKNQALSKYIGDLEKNWTKSSDKKLMDDLKKALKSD